jgi:hypothetical protein
MTDAGTSEVVREVVREVLAELLPQVAAENGRVVPQVPAPPVAAVHRPAGHEDAPPTANGAAAVEQVTIESDADLTAFALRLLHLYENPRDRQALRTGRLRFTLRRASGAAAGGGPATRIEKGAVTERLVDDAAAAGTRLVLGPRAVLTPMARDRAKKLNVEIEREKRC